MKKFVLVAIVAAFSGIFHAASPYAATYYVAVTGNDTTNSGTQAEPWRTISKGAASAAAGDTVYIKGGNYGHEHVVVANSGTATAPILFAGYDGMPVLDGEDWTGNGFFMNGKSYVTVKNIRAKNYRGGIWLDGGCVYCTLDGCVADSCTNTNFTKYGYDGYGIVVQRGEHCAVRNCSTTDNGGDNIFLSLSNYCTIQNCRVFSTQTVSNEFITDYYLVASWSCNNVIRDCLVEDVNGSYKGNHGIIFKDTPGKGVSGPHSTGNLVVNCTVKKLEECYAFAHGAYGNIVDSCHADNRGKKDSFFNFCFQVRDSAHGNTFRNCTAIGNTGCVSLYDGGEGAGDQSQTDNNFINCTFNGGEIGVFMRNAMNNTFTNCTFANIAAMFRFEKTRSAGADSNRANMFKNCILFSVPKLCDDRTLTINPWMAPYVDAADIAVTNTDFWNGFPPLSGKGNFSKDPLFADATSFDFHLKSVAGRWNGAAWVTDTVTSPCIDAGDRLAAFSNEPAPNGNRVNLGRYGNSGEASKSNPRSWWKLW